MTNMKKLLKYILLIFILSYMVTPMYAKKRSKKSTQKTTQKKSKKKNNKKSTKKPIKKGRQPKNKGNNTYKIPQIISEDIKEEPRTTKIDTIPEKVVTIMSAFKPQLKNVAKIGFLNASVQIDTTSLQVEYNVPSQNLSFQYKPISLIPRVYKIDSLIYLNNNGNIKAGYGNYFQHLLRFTYNMIDLNKNIHSLNVYNEAISGLHHLQNQKVYGINYIGDINFDKNNRLSTQVYFKQNNNFRYGLVPDSVVYPNSNYKQNYTHYGISLAFNNDQVQQTKLIYKPFVKYEHFDGINNASSNYFDIYNTISYDYKNGITFNFNIYYNHIQYNSASNNSISNSILKFDPTIKLDKFNSLFNIGVSPTFENGKYHIYPIIEFNKKLNDTNYVLMAGWKTENINNQYSNLAITNPWIEAPKQLELTTKDRKFIEIKINANKHLNYGFSLSFNNYNNLPLFNRIIDSNFVKKGLLYKTLFEQKASTIEFDANLRYQFSDKLLVQNTLKYIQFNSLQDNSSPWGILPFEFESNLNWKVNDKLSIDGNLKYWSGATISNQQNLPTKLSNPLVLGTGLNYKLSSKWTAWLKGQNLLDKPYERWSEYPSLGVQLMGGIVYSFSK